MANAQESAILQVSDLRKSFGDTEVLKGVSFDLGAAEFFTLLGPSGCGKTTTLRIVAGLETPDSGTVTLAGLDITALPPEKRDLNTVFQSYALFPTMNVYQNIAYGLRIKKTPKSEIEAKVKDALELVQLTGYEQRRPNELSGGQRQRAAIARAIVLEPKVLLLDEPLGALDLKLRKQMQVELKRLQRELGISFIYVTHDQEEALSMSDRIGVVREGVFEQVGTPEQIYQAPKSQYVADFIGETNFFAATVRGYDSRGNYLLRFDDGGAAEVRPSAGESYRPGDRVSVSVRPEHIFYRTEQRAGGVYPFTGTVAQSQFLGAHYKAEIFLDSGKTVHATNTNLVGNNPAGTQVYVGWAPESAIIVSEVSAS